VPKFHYFDVVESTNELAKQPQFQNAEHGTVIIADSQTAGKGRQGKSFFSPPNQGIYMSVILNSGGINTELVTVYAGVCVCLAIEALTDKKPQIKWVNDIFVNRKKICGILAENRSDSPNRVIVGIGLNFYNEQGEKIFDELQEAGCLFGSVQNRQELPNITKSQLINEIADRLTAPYSSPKEIIAEYVQRLIPETITEETRAFLENKNFY